MCVCLHQHKCTNTTNTLLLFLLILLILPIILFSYYILITTSPDRAAEQQLTEWLQSNYGELMKALVAEICTEGKPLPARQMASIYLKNTLYGKTLRTCSANRHRWMQLDAATRAVVKDGLLTALRSTEPGVPHFAAFTAAEVACVELPFNEWPGFVAALTENLNNNNNNTANANAATANRANIQQGTLECFGYTLERIAEVEEKLEGEVPELPVETVDKMLTSIVSCVQQPSVKNQNADDEALRVAALQALKNSLMFVRKNMEVKAERDFIMKNAIMGATQATFPALRSLAFSCLDQAAELYYEHLKDYMTDIFQLTTHAIQNDPDESVKMNAIEFWNTIAIVEQQLLDEEEIARANGVPLDRPGCQKYTQLALAQLVPLLLQTLTTQDENADDDDIGLSTTGSICLETISQTVEGHIIPLVLPFVQQHINSDNWHFRDAAIVAFAGILDGPDTESVRSFIVEIIAVLLGAFADPHETVRQSAVHCISTICRLHVAAIQRDQLRSILEALVQKLREPARVAAYACTAIYNIARAVKNTPGGGEQQHQTNVLSSVLMPVLQALFVVGDRDDVSEHNLRGNSMEAVAELIASAAMDVYPILVKIIPEINLRYSKAFQSNEDMDTKMQLLGSLSIVYNALLLKLSKADIAQHADTIMQNLTEILRIPNAACHDDVLLAVGNMANIMEEDFLVRACVCVCCSPVCACNVGC